MKLLQSQLGVREKDALKIKLQSRQAMEEQITQRKQQSIQKPIIIRVRAAVVIIGIFILSFVFSSLFVSSKRKTSDELFRQGIDAANHKNLPQAIENYTQAIQGDSPKAIYYIKRGNAYYIEKNFQKAIEDYNQAIRIDYTNTEAYRSRSDILSTLGNRKAAIKDLQQAASIYKKQGNKNDYEDTLNKLKKLQR